MRAVRVGRARGGPATYALVPAPGELPIAAARLDRPHLAAGGVEQHAHDFPGLVYFEAPGTLRVGGRELAVAGGDLYLFAPGDVIERMDRPELVATRGWSVFFSAEALGPDVPGSALAWRAHPLLFPFVRGGAARMLRLTVPAAARPGWESHIRALAGELRERRDGHREAAAARLVLLLVEVSRLAADLVDDLRHNNEPLLAEVFEVIERRYAEPLSLREVAMAVNVSPGHLTSTVRRRTGRTVLEWITERRMVQARQLLAGTALPVGEVARRVGFADPGYFARVFGRVHGTTPARWRAAGPG